MGHSPAALETIAAVGVIPVIRADSADTALKIADALAGAGLRVIEITMTVPNAVDVMSSITTRFGTDVVLGGGTITSSRAADLAIDAGCSFLVTPCLLPDVVAESRRRQTPIVCGALTPTEIFAAHQAGADLVKVFPAAPAGGPAYIRAIRGPFPDIGLVPTGGIGLEAVGDYFEAGAKAIGAGGELISKAAVARGDFRAIGETGRRFLDAARDARRQT